MKNLKAILLAGMMALAAPVFAQQSATQDAGKTKTGATSTVKTKQDGTPDKRYSENKKLKKDGTPDKRYSDNKNLKKDGTPDKRYKTNKDSVKTSKKSNE